MDNRAVEELLSSFASDTFAIQSQPEKDLRACLMNFFSVGHGPDGPTTHRNGNIHASSSRQSSHSASNPSVPVEAQMSVSYQASELPPPNTPLGSPIKEDIFNFSAATTNAFSPQNYPVTPSPADNKAQKPTHHACIIPSHNSSFRSCPSCSHSLKFHHDDPRLPHAPNCHFDPFDNNRQSPLSQDSNLSSSHSPSQCQLPPQFNPPY